MTEIVQASETLRTPHVSRVQSGEYPTGAEGTRQSCLFTLSIATEDWQEQFNHVLHSKTIKQRIA
jgi:hypothetical protein